MCHHLQLIQSSHRKEEELLSQILQVILKERKQRQTGPWPPRSKACKIRKHLGRFSTGYRKWSSANGIFGRRREDQFGDNWKRCMKISFYVPAMKEQARWCHQTPPTARTFITFAASTCHNLSEVVCHLTRQLPRDGIKKMSAQHTGWITACQGGSESSFSSL